MNVARSRRRGPLTHTHMSVVVTGDTALEPCSDYDACTEQVLSTWLCIQRQTVEEQSV